MLTAGSVHVAQSGIQLPSPHLFTNLKKRVVRRGGAPASEACKGDPQCQKQTEVAHAVESQQSSGFGKSVQNFLQTLPLTRGGGRPAYTPQRKFMFFATGRHR